MNLPQSFLVNVGINLGGGNTDVAEHFLDASQIGAAGQQMRCETMSQCMNSQISRHTRTNSIFFDYSPDFNTPHRPTGSGEQEKI